MLQLRNHRYKACVGNEQLLEGSEQVNPIATKVAECSGANMAYYPHMP
jgi:hypothetical protein